MRLTRAGRNATCRILIIQFPISSPGGSPTYTPSDVHGRTSNHGHYAGHGHLGHTHGAETEEQDVEEECDEEAHELGRPVVLAAVVQVLVPAPVSEQCDNWVSQHAHISIHTQTHTSTHT